jgi:hypothetical protein
MGVWREAKRFVATINLKVSTYSVKIDMIKLTITIVLCLFLMSQAPCVFAGGGNASKEIERVEITENSKVIYYKDGTKDMFIVSSVSIHFDVATSFSYAIYVPPLSPLVPIEKIFEILAEIIENITTSIGVGCTLLAQRIWNKVKELRNNRPKDYNGLCWKESHKWQFPISHG